MDQADKPTTDRVPRLNSDHSNYDQWHRQFLDYVTGRNMKRVLMGTAERPEPYTPAELAAIPAASRFQAELHRENKISKHETKVEEAFSAIVCAIEKDPVIYGCLELDALRQADPHDPVAAYTLIMDKLRPSTVDAQMTVDTAITTLAIKSGETVPALIQRLESLAQRLPVNQRPNDEARKKHIKRAIKSSAAMWAIWKDKVENLIDHEPPITYLAFCNSLTRKHESLKEEGIREAALNTETSQQAKHEANEKEEANATMDRSNKRKRQHKSVNQMSMGQMDGRIGAIYYGKGGAGENEQDGYRAPFNRGGYRHNGGRGFNFNQGGKGGRGNGGKSYYQNNSGQDTHKPKFDGNCNHCHKYGHKATDCYSKHQRK